MKKSGASPASVTPKTALHEYCHYCVQSRMDSEVHDCTGYILYATGKPCPLYPYRMGKRTPSRVLRLQCRECMGGNINFVKECHTGDCAIHPYRFGKNPKMKGASKDHMDHIRHHDTLFSAVKSSQDEFSFVGNSGAGGNLNIAKKVGEKRNEDEVV